LRLVGSIRADVSTRPFALLAGLAILAAACSTVPTATTVDYGSGPRLVVQVGDTLDNVGLASSVGIGADGQPFISYFGFPAPVKPGQIPIPRPIGTPFLPGVLLSTVDTKGTWTQGAVDQNKPAAVPAGITVPFGPVTTENFPLKEDDSNGTASVVASDGTVHTAWTMANGVYYGTTKLGGTAAVSSPPVFDYGTSVSLAGPMSAPGIALDGDGNPWIAFSAFGPSGLEVHAASLQGSKWNDQVVATEPPCDSCPEPGPTQIAFVGGGPVVVFGDAAKHEVDTATQQGSGWRVESLATKTSGLGLSVAAIENTLYASYYATDGTVNLTTVKGGAPTTTEAGQAEKPDPNDTGNDAPRTAVTAGSDGATYVAWDDGDKGVTFVSAVKDSRTFNEIPLGPSGTSSAHPALAASDAGVFLTWYDTVNQDLMMGQYGDVQNLIVANPPPSIVPSQSSAGAACPPAKKTQLDIVAQNTAFQPTCLIAPATQTFTINFDNRDSVSATGDHNIGIYDKAGGKELFRGDPVAGPEQVPYDVDALKAGTYFFQCDFHPSLMTGTLQVVQGAS
jgi:plastocyanin